MFFFGMARQGKAERGMFWCLCCIFGRYVGWLNFNSHGIFFFSFGNCQYGEREADGYRRLH